MPELEVVYVVVFSNYDPAEVGGIFRIKANAEKRAEKLNEGAEWQAWEVQEWRLEDAEVTSSA